MLTSLLAAVAGQRALDRPDLSASVLVVDNSPAGSGLDAAHAFADRAPLPVEVRHVPERGLSRARNAVLDAADGDLLAFIDDDEIPEPWWLGALLDSHRATSAPIITGPVIPRYGPAAPAAAKWGIMGILLLVSGSVRGSRVHLADGVLRGTRAVGMMGGLVGWRYPAY